MKPMAETTGNSRAVSGTSDLTMQVDDRGVAWLELTRPVKRNALTGNMLTTLATYARDLSLTPDLRLLVLHAQGPSFCAGADLGEWVDPTAKEAAALSRQGREAFSRLAELDIPSLAVIQGSAIGGGLELALACDVRVSTNTALLGLPEVRLGNLPAWGGMSRLIEATGLGFTRQLLLSGSLVSGDVAAQRGLVSEAVPEEDLVTCRDDWVDAFLATDPLAVALAKQLLADTTHTMPIEAALAAYTSGLDSSRKRKQAFLERSAGSRATPEHPTQKASPHD